MSGYANVYAYDDVLYVEPMHRGEVGLINGPPYLRVAKGDSADAIGGTTREALDASTMPAPFRLLRSSGGRARGRGHPGPAVPTVFGTPADARPQFVRSKLAPRGSTHFEVGASRRPVRAPAAA